MIDDISQVPRHVWGAERIVGTDPHEVLGWGIWVTFDNVETMIVFDPTLNHRLPSTFITVDEVRAQQHLKAPPK